MTAPTLPICGWLRATNPLVPRDGEREKAIEAADTLEICHRALELVWSNVALEDMVGEAVATARKKLRGDK